MKTPFPCGGGNFLHPSCERPNDGPDVFMNEKGAGSAFGSNAYSVICNNWTLKLLAFLWIDDKWWSKIKAIFSYEHDFQE